MGKKKNNNNSQPAVPSWKAALDQRAASGLPVGDQFFNSIGAPADARSEAISYANSQGYKLGNAWADVAQPVYNSAGDQVRRAPTEQPDGQLLNNILSSPTTTQDVNYQWVPGLLQPGQVGYDPASGGGAWVYAQGKVDPAALRAFYSTGVSPDIAFQPGSGLDRGSYTFNGQYGGRQSNQTFTAPVSGAGGGFDLFSAQMQAQQAATWQSIDAMNAEFVRQQQELISQQEQRINSTRSSINVGPSSPDAAKVKRKKRRSANAARTSSTNNGLAISKASAGVAGSGLSIGGA